MQPEHKRDVIQVLLDSGAVTFGSFTLKSGATSPLFIDLGQVASGRHLARLGDLLAGEVLRRFPATTLLFGPAYKGIALAAATAEAAWRGHGRDLRLLYDRKEAKAHGEGGSFIGARPGPDDRVVLIDDVLTSGLTKREGMAALRQAFGCGAVDILVVVDRRTRAAAARDDLPFAALLTVTELADHLAASGDGRAALIRRWWEETP